MNMHREDDCTCKLLPAVQQIANKYKEFVDGSPNNARKQQELLFSNNSFQTISSFDRNSSNEASSVYNYESCSNYSEKENEFLKEDRLRNRRQFTTIVTNTPSIKDSPMPSRHPLELFRVTNQSCPVHAKNTNQQSTLHLRSQSSNSTVLNNLKSTLFPVDRNPDTDEQTSSQFVGSPNYWTQKLMLVLVALVGFLLLSSVYISV